MVVKRSSAALGIEVAAVVAGLQEGPSNDAVDVDLTLKLGVGHDVGAPPQAAETSCVLRVQCLSLESNFVFPPRVTLGRTGGGSFASGGRRSRKFYCIFPKPRRRSCSVRGAVGPGDGSQALHARRGATDALVDARLIDDPGAPPIRRLGSGER